MKIGVFDSGVGGMSVVRAIKNGLPELEIVYAQDNQNVPYGNKTAAELHHLVLPILKGMVSDGCEAIVVACNSVTTNIINLLRDELSVPLIGIEPMVKPAAEQTKSKTIAVCATPATLSSKRYAWLKNQYAKDIKVLEPDCSDWAYMIESKTIDRQIIKDRLEEACQAGADVIVLGCTHYHWIEKYIQAIADKYKARVIQPETAIVGRLKQVLELSA